MDVRSHLKEVRERRGIAAAQLAARTGTSRQTIYAIEAGTYTPNAALALRLARTLETAVEELFELEEDAGGRMAKPECLPDEPAPVAGQPVRLARVGKKLVAAPGEETWEVREFDGVMDEAGRVELPAKEEERMVIAGCDPAMGVLARWLRRERVETIALPRNSARALALLEGGWVHVAGTHSRGGAGPKRGVAVYTFAVWEQGLAVARGNPKSIRGIEDLSRREVTMVNREEGAGSRALLDGELARLGMEPGKVRGYKRFAAGHLAAARMVARGEAACCVAPRVAARVMGLDFIPLASERYELAIRNENRALPAIERLLGVLGRPGFRREMDSLGGYDTRLAGNEAGYGKS